MTGDTLTDPHSGSETGSDSSSGSDSGIVFDIQRCSLHDGPGIRTTVFLKGCPLACLWCHNPESIAFEPQIAFDAAACAHCGACAAACEQGAHRIVDGAHRMDHARCTACGACVAACPNKALARIGERMTVAEVMAEVARDVDYYAASGGGLTVSGGEPMAQAAFTRALLAAARARGIHTCIETNGFAARARYAAVLPYVDLVLFDYKATGEARHAALTGAGQATILANLAFLHDAGAQIVLRCPLVPGVNDEPAHLTAIAELAARYPNLVKVEVMAYHDLGRDKGARIGRPWQLEDVPSADEERRARWLATLHDLGCTGAALG
jgi:pyruvate formate lyase activating enzyme